MAKAKDGTIRAAIERCTAEIEFQMRVRERLINELNLKPKRQPRKKPETVPMDKVS